MRLSEVSIERPVLATVFSLLIILFGAIGLTRLPNRELPNVDPPVVSVTTLLSGAAPEVVESAVTEPLEDELIGIEGIRHVTSTSREQVSQISVEFELGRDVEEAANDVRDRVARARRALPDEAESPVVAKRDADARPIMWMTVYGEDTDPIALTALVENRLRDRLGKLPGVANVMISGERRMSMRVWVDNRRLTAYQLTVADVSAALARENVDIPSGRVEGAEQEFTVRTLGELSTPEEFSNLIVTELDGVPIRLGDVARVEVGPETERKIVRFNGKPAIGIGVVKQSRANTLAVADAVKEQVRQIRSELPPGLEMLIAFDSSVFVQRSIEDVRDTILEAVVLVLAVIFLFLRNLRATLIPAVAIPVSIIGTFAVLYFTGFSINTLTLMGVTLAIGLVVDDAIVVLENISRWIEEGAEPHEAARQGMREIAFAVVTATISVVAVFLPLAFLSDKTGRLFREFGVTVAAAVAISGFVALTLAPMLCARTLRPVREERGVNAWLARGLRSISDGYARMLAVTQRRRGVTLTVGVLWFAAGMALLQIVPRELVPDADRGGLMVFTRAPEGSTIEYTDRYQQQAEEIVLAVPEIQKVFNVIALGIDTPGAVNQGAFFMMLKPWEDRDRSAQEVASQLRDELRQVPGITAFPVTPSPLRRSMSAAAVSLVIQGPDLELLERTAEEVRETLDGMPGFANVQSNLRLDKPQLAVHIDRDRASDLGVSVREVASTLQILLGGLDLSTFKHEGDIYDVLVQLERPERSEPRDLVGLYAHGRGGELIPLVSFIDVRPSTSPPGLHRFDRQRSATVTASLDDNLALGAALDQAKKVVEAALPAAGGYRLTFSGESEDFYESANAIVFAYGLAVVIIFLVLAAQFESFLHPLIIMVAVALSLTGALLGLLLSGHTLNLFSQIGLVMLIGLVTKNSILIVEFANQLRERGESLAEAVEKAARTRFRPILMTALSTIVGILPIALGLGAGGEARAPLGMAVVGGMFWSSLLTLFVVPAAYVAMEGLRERRGQRVGAATLAGAASGGS